VLGLGLSKWRLLRCNSVRSKAAALLKHLLLLLLYSLYYLLLVLLHCLLLLENLERRKTFRDGWP
jgi:hypothetical protein